MKTIQTKAYKAARSKSWDDSTNPGPPKSQPGPSRLILDDPGDSEHEIIDLWKKKRPRKKLGPEDEMPEGML